MLINYLDQALDFLDQETQLPQPEIEPTVHFYRTQDMNPAGLKSDLVPKVTDRSISYTQRHKGQWFRPEYDFEQIQIIEDVEPYVFRAIKRKTDRIVIAGFEFTGNRQEPIDYIERRVAEMELATNKPFQELMTSLYHDLFRYSNHMWVKVRSAKLSSGKVRRTFDGKEIEPVAGYFVLPFETLEFKTKQNGDIKKVKQIMPDGESKEFSPQDIVHFYTNRKPGFAVGTPEVFPAIEDIALLRRIEENVEELIEANLFPTYHYQVGNDNHPERYTPDGVKETDVVKRKIQWMKSGSVYVSDHRHQITAIGSEGKALRIDFYLTYFKNRVLAALGSSALDMGEGTGATKSTASALSKLMLMDIEACVVAVEMFINFFVINELLLEGGFNPLKKEDQVHIQFGVIDNDDRRADQNQAMLLFQGNLLTEPEARKLIGTKPLTDEDRALSYSKLYTEPMSMVKGVGAGSAVGEALAALPQSNLEPQHLAHEKEWALKLAKESAKAKTPTPGQSGARSSPGGASAGRTASSMSRPSNQHGTRTAPKTVRDYEIFPGQFCQLEDMGTALPTAWISEVRKRYCMVKENGVSLDTVVNNMLPRLRGYSND